MRIFNELLQWAAIGIILFLLIGIDLDFIKAIPKKINDIDRASSEQQGRISDIESRITAIESRLKDVASLNDVKRIEGAVQSVNAAASELSLNIEAQATSLSQIQAEKVAPLPYEKQARDIEKAAELYNSYKTEINISLLVVALIVGYLLYSNIRLRKSKTKLAPVTALISKYGSESSSDERDCA